MTNSEYLQSRGLVPEYVFHTPSHYSNENYMGLQVYELQENKFIPQKEHSFCIHRAKSTEYTKNKWLYDKGSTHTIAYCGEILHQGDYPIHIVFTEGLLDAYSMREMMSKSIWNDVYGMNPVGKIVFLSSTGGVGAIFTDKNKQFWKNVLRMCATAVVCLDNDEAGKITLIKGAKYMWELGVNSSTKIYWNTILNYKDANENLMSGDTLEMDTLFVTETHTQRELLGLKTQFAHTHMNQDNLLLYQKIDSIMKVPPKKKYKTQAEYSFGDIRELLPELGNNKMIKCPSIDHDDSTASCGFIPKTKDGNQLVHCFGCSKTWNYISLYAMQNNITNRQAFNVLKDKQK